MRKFSKKWLSVRARKELKESRYCTPSESIFSQIDNFRHFIKQPNSWRFVVPFVLIIYLLCFFDLRIPGTFSSSHDQAIELLNDRLIHLITLFSVSVVVAVFVVSAMQAKRVGEELFSTIFRESYIYPIIFFVLSVIGITAIVSQASNEIQDVVLIRINTLGLVTFITTLIVIGFLFVRIFKFINTDYLLNRYIKNIERLSNIELERELFERISRMVYKTFFDSLGAKEDYLRFYSKEKLNQSKIRFNEAVVIDDVNFNYLLREIKKINGGLIQNMYYIPLGINDSVYSDTVILGFNSIITENRSASILKAYRRNNRKREAVEYYEQKKKMKSRLISSVIENDFDSVDNILTAYYSIHKVFALSVNRYNIDESLSYYSSNILSIDDWNVIKDLDRHIFLVSKKAIETKNREFVKEVFNYLYKIMVIAITEENETIIRKYLYMASRIYYVSRLNPELRNLISSTASSDWTNLIRLHIFYLYNKFTEIDKRIKLNTIYHAAFTGFNGLLKTMIDEKDYMGFQIGIKEFNQLELNFKYRDHANETIKRLTEIKGENKNEIEYLEKRLNIDKQPARYHRAVVFGLQSWLWFLYHSKKITHEELAKFIESIKLPNISYTEKVNDLIYYASEGENLFDWSNWDIKEHPIGEVFIPLDTNAWINFGMVVWLLRQGRINPSNLKDIQNSDIFLYKEDQISRNCDYLYSNYNDWKDILGNVSKDELERKISLIKELFSNLKRRIELKIDKEIISQSLSPERIKVFINSVGESWENNSIIHKIFEQFEAIDIITDQNVSLRVCGQSINLEGGKMMFVEEQYQEIFGIEHIGSSVAHCVNREFSNKLISSKHSSYEFDDTISAIEKLISHMKENGQSANIIMMDSNLEWEDESLYKSEKFIPIWRSGHKLDRNFIGHYDNIPIVGLHNELFHKKIMVSDFTKAFKMRQRQDNNWFNKLLKIEIIDVSDEEAERIYSIDPTKWSKNKDGRDITKEEAIVNIKKDITINIAQHFEFIILDNNSFDLAIIKIKK